MRSSSHLATDDIEPLEPTLWFGRFELMCKRLDDENIPLEHVLRQVFHLVQLTPCRLRHLLAITVLEEPFETLLEAGCYDAAVLALAGTGMDLSVQRRRDASVAVTLSLGHKGPAGSGEAAGLARAGLRAYCRCVIALDVATNCPPATNLRAQGTRSGSHQPSTH